MRNCKRCFVYSSKEKISGIPIYYCTACNGIRISKKHSQNFKEVFSIDNGIEDYQYLWVDKEKLQENEKLSNAIIGIKTSISLEKKKKKALRNESLAKIKDVENPVALESTRDRNKFIHRVYKLFFFSLLFSGAGGYLGVILDIGYSSFYKLFFIELLILILAFILRKRKIWNYIILFTFTGFSGFTTSPMLNSLIRDGQSTIIYSSFIATVVLFLSLSFFAYKSKKDFSFMGGFLFSSLTILVLVGLLSLFTTVAVNPLIYSSIGLILFCGFVIYDTSRVLMKYELDEYVSATLDLYLDFINIFVDMLRLFKYSPDIDDLF